MEKVRYMISDAAAMAGVESHVLRYWEEELDLTIPRNEMGHRYYTREILHNGPMDKPDGMNASLMQPKAEAEKPDASNAAPSVPVGQTTSNLQAASIRNDGQMPQAAASSQVPPSDPLSAEERMAQFRELMSDIVGRAIAQNNEELSLNIGQEVRETVLKEMNYLFREQEEAQEDRYKKLDAAIRGNLRKKRSLFAKKDKPVKPAKDKTDVVPNT